MTRADRAELARVARMRAKVARNGIDARKAELLADFEEQLATEYDFDDARWSAITAAARRAVEEADKQIAAICEEVGIPADFRPRLTVGWYDRGKNAVAQRRAELRKAAVTRLDAAGKAAKVSIDQSELAACTELATGALETDEARQWLARLPTVEDLLPQLRMADVEAGRALGEGRLDAKERYALPPRWEPDDGRRTL